MTPPSPTPSADSTPPAPSARSAPSAPARVDIDRDSVGRDLVALVLTVVELLRQLMERQAIRRIDAGGLTDDQIERIGTTLMLLDQRMAELCDQHGLTAEDLNLDLGPLGTLLPRA
ncbi:gas vesicle protein K [Streptomyces sp. RKCA744]|uniref:gas vesicle protein K n=1 Tax=Streptomyces sp. RKCA744 TaxID=2959340 RepID=UPI00263F8B88|nr:gas vesicle protein K [Streptomyces sp. RKCA744]